MRHIWKLVAVSFIILVIAVALPDRPAGLRVLVIDPISKDPADIPSVVSFLDRSGYSVTHIIDNDVTVERLKALDARVDVLVMGCDAAGSSDLADVFLGKGASLYVSWDGPVSLEYTDLMFSRILDHFTDGKTMDEAVGLASSELGMDPHFKSTLRCFKQ
jgi:hypothetical protein